MENIPLRLNQRYSISPVRGLMRELIVVVFGVLFSAVGFVNTFWGNDPYYGLAVLMLFFCSIYR